MLLISKILFFVFKNNCHNFFNFSYSPKILKFNPKSLRINPKIKKEPITIKETPIIFQQKLETLLNKNYPWSINLSFSVSRKFSFSHSKN